MSTSVRNVGMRHWNVFAHGELLSNTVNCAV